MRISKEEIERSISYDPDTGNFIRVGSSTNTHLIGKVAGRIDRKGYRVIRIGSKIYKAHRLAWVIMTGDWPDDQIDHIDMDKANNRWGNLRAANNSGNQANSIAYRNNKIGVKGVRVHSCGKYEARIRKDKKLHSLGLFDSLDAARSAYEKAAGHLHGEFARAA